jgi:hypothetical protein
MMRNDLTKSLGMKCDQMRWVSRALTAGQKATGVEMAGRKLQTLESHEASNFHFLWTGDELWMFYECHHETMWAPSREEGGELEQPTHYRRKAMVTASLNGTGSSY